MPEPDTATFEIEVDGEGIEPGKFPVRDLPRLAQLIQEGLERTARVLTGEPGGAPGPLPRPIDEVTRLLLVGVRRGSATLALELPAPPEKASDDEGRLFPIPTRELGFRAMERWIAGLHELESGSIDRVPDGWDNSVMDIAERLAEFATERRVSMTLDGRPPRQQRARARITPETSIALKQRHTNIRRKRSVRGRLVAVDLGRGRVDVEDKGRRVECQFPEGLERAVKQLIGETVVVSGEEEFDPSTGKAQKLQLESLDRAPEEIPLSEEFWGSKSIEELARDQGVGPIASVAALAAPDLFDDETIEHFISTIREGRREE